MCGVNGGEMPPVNEQTRKTKRLLQAKAAYFLHFQLVPECGSHQPACHPKTISPSIVTFSMFDRRTLHVFTQSSIARTIAATMCTPFHPTDPVCRFTKIVVRTLVAGGTVRTSIEYCSLVQVSLFQSIQMHSASDDMENMPFHIFQTQHSIQWCISNGDDNTRFLNALLSLRLKNSVCFELT